MWLHDMTCEQINDDDDDDEDMVAMKGEIVRGLSNGTITNDFEWPWWRSRSSSETFLMLFRECIVYDVFTYESESKRGF